MLLASLVLSIFNLIRRYMLGLAAVPAIIQLIGFLFMPESPRYLVKKGKDQLAINVNLFAHFLCFNYLFKFS